MYGCSAQMMLLIDGLSKRKLSPRASGVPRRIRSPDANMRPAVPIGFGAADDLAGDRGPPQSSAWQCLDQIIRDQLHSDVAFHEHACGRSEPAIGLHTKRRPD